MTSRTNPITGFDVTLMPPTPDARDLFGWIRLINGAEDAGYVYLQDDPQAPRIGGNGYIVTALPVDRLAVLLDLLRSGAELQIRVHRAGEAGASVFIEPRDASAIGDDRLALPAEEVAALGR